MADKLNPTICFAAIHTVLTENFLPHMSNKSSRLGPRRSMTRMLCKPSCPKWYICGIPALIRISVSKVTQYWGRSTDCSLLGYGMNDIHHEAEVLRLFSAPMTSWEMTYSGGMAVAMQRTNLMATVWELRRLVPKCYEQLLNRLLTYWTSKDSLPSKITPNEPSPIFLPTR